MLPRLSARFALAIAAVSVATCTLVGPLAIPVTSDLDFGNIAGVGPSILNLPALEIKRGVIALSTQAQADAGVDDTTAITPLKLKNAAGVAKKFSATIGGATSIPVVHGLGTLDVACSAYLIAAPSQNIEVECQHTSTSTVTFVFAAPAPPAASIRVVVFG